MSIICEFCNKSYSTLSSLNYHKKTTKFCIELQKQSNININLNPIYNCDYCEKNFTTKSSLSNHITICDFKICREKVENEYNEYKVKVKNEYNEYKIKVESEYNEYKVKVENDLTNLKENISKNEHEIKLKDDQILEYKLRLESKDEQLKMKDEQLKSKDDMINKLQQQLESLTKELIKRPQIVNNNNTNSNNYTIEFNKLKNELLPFTDANIKNCINSIDGNNLIFFNDYDINSNFIHNFVNAIKVMTFCTDASRGSLIVVDENKKHKKMVATQFIMECFEKSTPECIAVINKAMAYVKSEHESEDSVVSTDDYTNCMHALYQIREHLKLNKPPADLVKLLSSNLTKNVKQCSKNSLTSIDEINI